MTERAELSHGLPKDVSIVDTRNVVEKSPSTSREIRKHKSRLLKAAAPLIIAAGALAIAACGGDGGKEQEDTRTWTGILAQGSTDCSPSAECHEFYLLDAVDEHGISSEYIPLEGEVLNERYDGFIVEVTGARELNPINVREIRPLNDFPYHPFLIEATPNRALIEYGCRVPGNFTESFRLDGEKYILVSKLTKTSGGSESRPYPSVEFKFDGKTGDFLGSDVEPDGDNPCQ